MANILFSVAYDVFYGCVVAASGEELSLVEQSCNILSFSLSPQGGITTLHRDAYGQVDDGRRGRRQCPEV